MATSKYIYEPELEWRQHDGTCVDRSINPDLLVQRPDGYFDIYDLKTAATHRANLTKGGRKRRRFVDYVDEGVAQLANYREYFQYPGNAEHAKQKYGVEVKEPKLVLIVGSWDNVNATEVKQACRRYSADVEIVDYDTLRFIYENSGPQATT